MTDAKIPIARAQDPGEGLETYGTLKHVCVKAPVLVYKGAGLGRLWDATLGCCLKKWRHLPSHCRGLSVFCLVLSESGLWWTSLKGNNLHSVN